MDPDTRRLVRWAGRIRDCFLKQQFNHHDPLLNETSRLMSLLQRIEPLRSSISRCARHGWQAALRDRARHLDYCLADIGTALNHCVQFLNRAEARIPDLREMIQDLQELESEFDQVKLDAEALCATTDSIELEDVGLGRFEIRLELKGLSSPEPGSCLRVVALDPNPAAGNSSVTHPHVKDERLCAGEASLPLKQAMAQGRLCDVFTLARSVLTTYNEDSPYVPLAKWHGHPCYDCGYVTDDEEDNWCDGCERDFCNDCFSYCRMCDLNRCRGCLIECVICSENCCERCLKTCPGCAERVCTNCLEEDMCSTCHEKEENHANESTDEQGQSTEGGSCEVEAQQTASQTPATATAA